MQHSQHRNTMHCIALPGKSKAAWSISTLLHSARTLWTHDMPMHAPTAAGTSHGTSTSSPTPRSCRTIWRRTAAGWSPSSTRTSSATPPTTSTRRPRRPATSSRTRTAKTLTGTPSLHSLLSRLGRRQAGCLLLCLLPAIAAVIEGSSRVRRRCGQASWQSAAAAAAQVVLAGVLLLPGHAEPRGAAVVGGAVRAVQVQGLHAQPLCLE